MSFSLTFVFLSLCEVFFKHTQKKALHLLNNTCTKLSYMYTIELNSPVYLS